jgi:hypothetical protein
MFNEAIRVTGVTGSTAKSVFQRSEWTIPSGQFDEGSPAGSRYVDQRSPGMAKRDETTENDESDK